MRGARPGSVVVVLVPKEYLLGVKSVPIQDLKQRLSAVVSEAEAGEKILVTRHGRPVALLTSAAELHLTVGARFGRAALAPLLSRRATKGRYLALLEEDRGDGSGAR